MSDFVAYPSGKAAMPSPLHFSPHHRSQAARLLASNGATRPNEAALIDTCKERKSRPRQSAMPKR